MESAASTPANASSSAPLDDALTTFTDAARRDEARRSRQQRADQAMVDDLSGTFLGALVELAETRRPVTVLTRSGAHHRGLITTVGRDVVVMGDGDNPSRVLLALAAVEAIRAAELGVARRSQAIDSPTLIELLDLAAEDSARASLVTNGGNRISGTLRFAGEDQVGVMLDGDADMQIIAIRAIDEVVVGS